MGKPQLERKLGLWASVSIVAGAIIGSGIFMKPAVMAGQLGSPLLLLGIWVIAGIVSLIGGMINAEIGAMLPKTGGQYVFFQKMYGDFFAFLYGWASFIVINTAAIAAISFVFAQYTEFFSVLPRFSPAIEKSFSLVIPGIGTMYPLEQIGVKGLAMFAVLMFTLINYRSVKSGGNILVFFTVAKVLSLVALVFMIFLAGNGDTGHFVQAPAEMQKTGWMAVMGLIAALSGALGSYDGWNNIVFVAGEIKNPAKNIPRGLFLGLLICVIIYIATNLAYLYALPLDKMRDSELVAAEALRVTVGASGAGFVSLLVILSTLGCINANVLPCARIQFAMSEDRLFFKNFGKVHPVYHTPGNALWMQAAVSCLFIFTGSFDMLFDLFVFVTWLFYGFAAAGLFVLRKKMPDAERSYKVWGYPWLPVIFILFAAFYFFLTIYNDVTNYLEGKTGFINSLYGLLLVMTGVPFYLYFRKKRQAEPDSSGVV